MTSERQLFNSWLPDTEDEDEEETDGAGGAKVESCKDEILKRTIRPI